MANRWSCNVTGSPANDGLTALTPKANPYEHTPTDGDTFRTKGTGIPYDRPGFRAVLDLGGRQGMEVCDWDGFPKPVFTHTGAGVGFGRCIWIGDAGPGMNIVRRLIVQDTVEAGMGSPGADGVNLTVDECELYRIGMAHTSLNGASLCLGATTAVESLIIRRSIMRECGSTNIFAHVNGDFEVGYCTVTKPGIASPGVNLGDCIACADSSPSFYWVHHNTLNHADKDSKHCIQQSGPTTGRARFEFNTLLGPKGFGVGNTHKTVHSEMFTELLCNRIITGGFAVELKGGGDIVGNGILINGVGAWGFNQGPIYSENVLASLTRILHNTIILVADGSGLHSAISIFDGEDGQVHNNVIEGFAVGIRRHASSVTESHNCIRGATDEVTDHNLTPIATGTGTITDDPMIGYDFMPAIVSPCVGTGTPIPGFLDLTGIPFMALPTMGCREVRRRIA